MRPVARQMIVLTGATLVALAVLIAYFIWPVDVDAFRTERFISAEAQFALDSERPSAWFVDVTAASGVQFVHRAGKTLKDIRQVMSPGFGLADLSGDGLIDLFLLSPVAPGEEGRPPNVLYINQGGLRFESVPGAGGADAGEWAMGCAIADFDSDGDQDVYVTALGPNHLYRNEGNGRFHDVASQAGIADPRWSTGAGFADYDLDGDLDLYVSNYLDFAASRIPAEPSHRYDRDEPPAFSPYVFPPAPDALFRNDRGVFEDVTESVGIPAKGGKGMAVLFADLDDDRLADLLVINDVSRNSFFHNVDGRRFEDAGAASGLADPRSGMGIALGDFDNDGAFDVFSTHWQDESNVLYRQIRTENDKYRIPFFEDVTIQTGLAAPSMGNTGWGASWGDVDLDGDLDLLVVNGYTSPAGTDPTQCIGQPTMLFISNGGQFVDRAADSGLEEMAHWAARGASMADLDDDGDLDIVIAVNNGSVHIFENRLQGGSWLKIRPVGGVVIGAVVRIRSGERSQQRMILSGSSYLCSEPPEAHFGLGSESRADELVVSWPDGTKQSLRNVAANQTLVVQKP